MTESRHFFNLHPIILKKTQVDGIKSFSIRSLKRALNVKSYELNRGEKFRPFFVVGSGRSGNTLLRRILDSNSKIYIPPETYVLGRAINLFKQNQHLDWRQIVYLILAQFEFHREFETFGVSLRPLAEELIQTPYHQRSLAFILNKFYEYSAFQHGSSFERWGDKTPLNTFFLKEILSVFPDAQFIHLIRDGLDVVPSYTRAGIYDSINDASERWVKSVKLASDFVEKHPKTCITVKYEDLVTSPEATVIQICNFLNIDFDQVMLNSHEHAQTMGDVVARNHHQKVFEPISSGSIGKGRKTLKDKEVEVILELIGKERSRFGYEL